MITESHIRAALRNAPKKPGQELKDDGGRGAGRLALLVRAMGDQVTAECMSFIIANVPRRAAEWGVPGWGTERARACHIQGRRCRESKASSIPLGRLKLDSMARSVQRPKLGAPGERTALWRRQMSPDQAHPAL